MLLYFYLWIFTDQDQDQDQVCCSRLVPNKKFEVADFN